MKIVNRKQLMGMDTPILFSHYVPCYIDGLFICTDNKFFETDFVEVSLLDDAIPLNNTSDNAEVFDILIDAEENGTEFRLDLEGTCREGLFDDTKLYAVYDKEDIKRLVNKLSSLL